MPLRLFLQRALVFGLLAAPAQAEPSPDLDGPAGRASYSLGYQVGQDLARQGVALDRPALVRGLTDGRSGAEPLMTAQEMSALLAGLKHKIVAEAERKRRVELDAVKQAGRDFLERNKARPGVQTTDSGLQYKVLKHGSGKQPGPVDRVRVTYRAATIEGREFDSSERRGGAVEFALGSVTRGWSEGLQLMREGAKYELFLPYELAYNRRGPLAYQTVVLEVGLLAVNPEPAQATVPAKDTK